MKTPRETRYWLPTWDFAQSLPKNRYIDDFPDKVDVGLCAHISGAKYSQITWFFRWNLPSNTRKYVIFSRSERHKDGTLRQRYISNIFVPEDATEEGHVHVLEYKLGTLDLAQRLRLDQIAAEQFRLLTDKDPAANPESWVTAVIAKCIEEYILPKEREVELRSVIWNVETRNDSFKEFSAASEGANEQDRQTTKHGGSKRIQIPVIYLP